MKPEITLCVAARRCQEAFRDCIMLPEIARDNWIENRLGDFNLWIADLHVDSIGHASLDYRLREREDVKDLVVVLLESLINSLHRCKTIGEGSPEPRMLASEDQDVESDGSDSSLSSLSSMWETEGNEPSCRGMSRSSPLWPEATNVQATLYQLTRLGMAIRKSGTTFRHANADQSLNKEDHAELESYLTFILLYGVQEHRLMTRVLLLARQETISTAAAIIIRSMILNPARLTILQRRLIHVNIIRRNWLEFMRKRRQTPKGLTPQNVQQLKPPSPRKQASDPPAIKNEDPPTAVKILESTTFEQSHTESINMTATQLGSGFAPQITRPAKANTVVTKISATGLTLDYPKSPGDLKARQTFQCPFCCQVLQEKYAKSGWNAHIHQDISPYTCFFEDCPSPYQLYDSKLKWLAHLRAQHSTQCWKCPFSQNSTLCRESTFFAEEDWIAHLRGYHLQHGVVTDAQIRVLAGTNMTQELSTGRCPLCGFKGDEPSTIDHIAQHLHAFALRALPDVGFSDERPGASQDSRRIPSLSHTSNSSDSSEALIANRSQIWGSYSEFMDRVSAIANVQLGYEEYLQKTARRLTLSLQEWHPVAQSRDHDIFFPIKKDDRDLASRINTALMDVVSSFDALDKYCRVNNNLRSQDELHRLESDIDESVQSLMAQQNAIASFNNIPVEPAEEVEEEAGADERRKELKRLNTSDQWEIVATVLDGAIQAFWQAVEATSGNEARYLSALGNLLSMRYSLGWSLSDLDEAIQALQEALRILPADNPGYAANLDAVGNLLGKRYLRTGTSDDLDESVRIARRAVQATLEQHSDQMAYLNNLGNQLFHRHLRIGALDELGEAVELGRQVIKATSESHEHRAAYLNNLSMRLGSLFLESRKDWDLEEAIFFAREAVSIASVHDQKQPGGLTDLITGLRSKYPSTSITTDAVPDTVPNLEKTIQDFQQAFQATLEDYPCQAACWNNLSIQLRHRYLRERRQVDLEEAIDLGRQAVKATPDNHPDRAVYLNDLGIQLWDRFSTKGATADLEEAIACHDSAFWQQTAFIHTRFQAGQNLFHAYATISNWHQAYVTARRAIYLIPQLISPKLQYSDKRHLLREVANIAVDGAAAALNAQKEAVVALTLLEEGLEAFTVFYKGVVSLQAPSENKMRFAARHGPIVTINISQYRCDAIFVDPKGIGSLKLPNFNAQEIDTKAEWIRWSKPQALKRLWDCAMGSVLEALGFTRPPPDDKWPRVCWILTGPLRSLPVHAAGYHEKGALNTVLDRVESSYGLSLKAVIQDRGRPASLYTKSTRTLIAYAENAQTPGLGRELETITSICESMGLDTIRSCKKQEIIQQLTQCNILHYAGYCQLDNVDPLKTRLVLAGYDGTLTVTNVLELGLQEHSHFFAYLSSSKTAAVEYPASIPGHIHMARSFKLAGFRHVIGTLGHVDDRTFEEMAATSYKILAEGSMTDESVSKALHLATKSLRDRWLERMSVKHKEKEERSTIAADDDNKKLPAGANVLSPDSDDDDDDDDVDDGYLPLSWAQFVHYGV
ncbi:CHAT domain-containing protein [Aspergillus karnatakaensis]|uniref:CHAT domain-containing protein n=1 Tax=Aspergillus karnatakaensis TaxID=1810916 RepID=UPI003CCD99C5